MLDGLRPSADLQHGPKFSYVRDDIRCGSIDLFLDWCNFAIVAFLETKSLHSIFCCNNARPLMNLVRYLRVQVDRQLGARRRGWEDIMIVKFNHVSFGERFDLNGVLFNWEQG